MKRKIIFQTKYKKPGRKLQTVRIGDDLEKTVRFDFNFSEEELIVEINGKRYEGLRIMVLREQTSEVIK